MRGFTDENKFSGSLLRRDRNFRLAIPSLIVNNHRPGFSSAQLLIRHGSRSKFNHSVSIILMYLWYNTSS
ncbi:MAG: hypothetical protein K6F18_01890 [Lactobacillus sp.]|nr:hypothetical protein [Lactobacillus sp.]